MRTILKLLILLLVKVILKNPKKIKRKRKQYEFVFKMDVIQQVESGIPSFDVAFNNNIDKSLASRWIQNKKEIIIDGASN